MRRWRRLLVPSDESKGLFYEVGLLDEPFRYDDFLQAVENNREFWKMWLRRMEDKEILLTKRDKEVVFSLIDEVISLLDVIKGRLGGVGG